MTEINTVSELGEILANGPYAWPGGYPLYFIMGDGEAMSFDAVRDNLPDIVDAMTNGTRNDEWRVIGAEINWEDGHLYCVHTGNRIESAYAEETPNTD